MSLSFPLSLEPEYGQWTIRVEATNTFTQHLFYVELFTMPRFEVMYRELCVCGCVFVGGGLSVLG